MFSARKLAGTALLLTFLVCTMGASSIDFDKGQPNPNPGGKQFILEGKGPVVIDPNELFTGISFVAVIGTQAATNPGAKNNQTWSSNLILALNTYDSFAVLLTKDAKTGLTIINKTKTVTVTVK